MTRVVHFEIHADDPARAIGFYAALFGWQFQQMPRVDYWYVTTGPEDAPGINGGLMPRQEREALDGTAVTGYVCTIEIDDLDAYVAKAEAEGGRTVVPKAPIPNVGWSAYCKDTEGNLFGMMEFDPLAA